jgi:hypothetical protein
LPEVPPGLAGTAQRTRYVVQLDTPLVDPTAWRTALAEDPEGAALIAEQARTSLAGANTALESSVQAVQGRVVTWWWMSSEATVELPAGGVATVQVAPGVKGIRPDQTPE